jgi:hypothetical protein
LEVLDDEDADEEYGGDCWAQLRRWVHQSIVEMYENRYEMPWSEIPWGPPRMHHVLFTLKSARPDQFCEELCVTPCTFDILVTKLQHDVVFGNNSCCSQMPVEEQLAITLFHFGHDGNAAGLQGVASIVTDVHMLNNMDSQFISPTRILILIWNNVVSRGGPFT